MVRVGWHKPAKVLIYPIRDKIDAEGRQLINWVCDIEQEHPIEKIGAELRSMMPFLDPVTIKPGQQG